MFKGKTCKKQIGSVIINGRLWKPSVDGTDPFIFKTVHSYILMMVYM